MTGPRRLMTSSCQSSSHRESRALPSAPKLMGRRRGGEATRPRVVGKGERMELWWWKWRPRTGQIIGRVELMMDYMKGSANKVKRICFCH